MIQKLKKQRHKMKTKRILTAALLLAAVILSACTKDYKEEDVIKYIREEMGLSGRLHRQNLDGVDEGL